MRVWHIHLRRTAVATQSFFAGPAICNPQLLFFCRVGHQIHAVRPAVRKYQDRSNLRLIPQRSSLLFSDRIDLCFLSHAPSTPSHVETTDSMQRTQTMLRYNLAQQQAASCACGTSTNRRHHACAAHPSALYCYGWLFFRGLRSFVLTSLCCCARALFGNITTVWIQDYYVRQRCYQIHVYRGT